MTVSSVMPWGSIKGTWSQKVFNFCLNIPKKGDKSLSWASSIYVDSAQDVRFGTFWGKWKKFLRLSLINATGLRLYTNFKRKNWVKFGIGKFNNHWILKIAHQFLEILSIQSQNKTN